VRVAPPDQREVTLSAQALTQRFGPNKIFDSLSFEVPKGGGLVVTGPNGSGKTTLLRILSGLLRPTKGVVRLNVDGKVISPEERLRHIGFITPELALYEELTALENLEFFARVRRLKRTKADHLALLERVGLKERGRDLVGTFSSGMKQRLKLAFAIQHEPMLLLLDEPGNNLDDSGRAVVEGVVVEQKKKGVLIVATNDARELTYGEEKLALA
jgi:heme exporter protein A